jgi:gliding motility-associated-like protein
LSKGLKYIIITVISSCFFFFSGIAQKDSISFNSTCANFKIAFNSNIFDSISFPDKVKWNFGDPGSGIYNSATIQAPSHLYASPGVYPVSLMVLIAGDTLKFADTIHVIVPTPYNFGPDIYLCEKGDTSLQAPIIAGANYLWNDDSLTTTPTLKVTKTGVYTVKINGCAVTDSIGVFLSNLPDIKLGGDHVMCAGETLTLNAATQNGNYTWELNGTVLAGDTLGQLITQAPGGQYMAVVSVPGCGTFKDTANITYSTYAAPSFSLGPDTLLCPKEIYPLTANVTGASAYLWSTKEQTQTIQINSPGVYWAFVTVASQCEVVDTVQVMYRGDKNLDFHDTAICKGSTLILDADFGVGTYNWVSDPPQRDDQNQTKQSTYYVYEPGLYSVVAQVGQCIYKDSLHVTFNDSLDLNIGRDTTLCIGEEFILHVKTNANEFAWQDGSTALSYVVGDSGIYQVIAKNGCGSDTASVHIARKTCSCELTLPNAFTPNNDGLNDVFRPLHPCNMTEYLLRIFDRYGKLVYQTSDFGRGWNGTYNGMPAENGTFVWMATYRNTDTKVLQFRKGFVIVVY